MHQVRIRQAIGTGWRKFMQRPWYLFGLTLAVMVLFALASGDMIVAALAYIIFGGYLALAFRHYDGEKVVFDDLFSLDSRWISFAFLALIKGMLILAGFICFIIPGIYLSVRWMFAEYLVIDRGMKPLQALRASSTMTAGNRWKLFGFTLVAILVMLLGFVALIFGVFVSTAVVVFATIKLYRDLVGKLD